ncbi:heterokaryon incompatibility protein [Colletotrichum sojae]|uniref:Heterokaryon incompatibility protein n=1 Tax=Colletotrichum sojae TaxID=2175907 RepID=A0A8H6ITR9_9PEZI|nr:heterokaryon incompatibility protein [Colletotrichum sojae]
MPFMPEQSPFICCDTQRCRVFAFQTALEDNKISLFGDSKTVIGTVHLHNDEQLQEFPKSNADWAAGKEVELVAICRVRRHSKLLGEEVSFQPLLESWDAYVVLWVEWSDGVAYRLASGEVDKEAWEGMALEDVALVLV